MPPMPYPVEIGPVLSWITNYLDSPTGKRSCCNSCAGDFASIR